MRSGHAIPEGTWLGRFPLPAGAPPAPRRQRIVHGGQCACSSRAGAGGTASALVVAGRPARPVCRNKCQAKDLLNALQLSGANVSDSVTITVKAVTHFNSLPFVTYSTQDAVKLPLWCGIGAVSVRYRRNISAVSALCISAVSMRCRCGIGAVLALFQRCISAVNDSL
jgi:hypothetical protein